jgi:hypothetical protein
MIYIPRATDLIFGFIPVISLRDGLDFIAPNPGNLMVEKNFFFALPCQGLIDYSSEQQTGLDTLNRSMSGSRTLP